MNADETPSVGLLPTTRWSLVQRAGQEPAAPARVAMEELLRTNDLVLISFADSLLREAGIDVLVVDQNMSVIEGSLGILPRRILVHEDDNRAARALLADAGLAHELRPDE